MNPGRPNDSMAEDWTESLHGAPDFETLYTRIRAKEGRIYTDLQVEQLPVISKYHTHYREWRLRARSASCLREYLYSKGAGLSILEVGCGNGWLCHCLSRLPQSRVTGIDVNRKELVQASRVFSQVANIGFVEGDITKGAIRDSRFHIILFASSIQYFPSCQEVIGAASTLLVPGGEIHIMDSMFYEEKDLDGARQRSRAYFHSMKVPGMEAFYHHHSLTDLEPFRYKVHRRPKGLLRVIDRDPFYWISIQKE